MFTEQDLNDLNERGISLEQIETQLNCFREGFPYLKIVAPASIGRGIIRLDEAGQKHYLDRWSRFLEGDRVITKFVPASGAASRMFKDLFAFLNGAEELPTTDFERRFFGAIRRFAFFDALNKKCVALYGKKVSSLCVCNRITGPTCSMSLSRRSTGYAIARSWGSYRRIFWVWGMGASMWELCSPWPISPRSSCSPCSPSARTPIRSSRRSTW